MILYTINGSGSDAVQTLANVLTIKIESRSRSDHRVALESINRSATVPTLQSDDLVLTETVAILRFLANKYDSSLLGKTESDRAKVDELLSIISTGLYAGYIQFFRPEKFCSHSEMHDDVKRMAATNLAQALDHLEAHLPKSNSYLIGDYPTLVDFYLPVLLRWQQNIQPLNNETPKLLAYWNFVQQQPCAQK